jgi:hypothetical protein
MLRHISASSIRVVREQRKWHNKTGDLKVSNVVLARCPNFEVRHKKKGKLKNNAPLVAR